MMTFLVSVLSRGFPTFRGGGADCGMRCQLVMTFIGFHRMVQDGPRDSGATAVFSISKFVRAFRKIRSVTVC
jgi:hypothetical protein